MKSVIQAFIICLYIFTSVFAVASGTWQKNVQSFALIGEGTLKVFVWKLYDLKLFSETNSFSWQNRFILEFDYKREMKKDRVIEASLKEMRSQKGVAEKDINAWQRYLEKVINAAQSGTKAAVEWTPGGQITFYYEGKAPVTINDEPFAKSFISIWLGRETSEPELRSALLGQEQLNSQ
tara:strand:- start:2860 stop:3396 length:537 start_codon:yes stop_codon:yes gene_type:complete